jgi:hypothetical protein
MRLQRAGLDATKNRQTQIAGVDCSASDAVERELAVTIPRLQKERPGSAGLLHLSNPASQFVPACISRIKDASKLARIELVPAGAPTERCASMCPIPLAEAVGQSGKAAHLHSDRQVIALHN